MKGLSNIKGLQVLSKSEQQTLIGGRYTQCGLSASGCPIWCNEDGDWLMPNHPLCSGDEIIIKA